MPLKTFDECTAIPIDERSPLEQFIAMEDVGRNFEDQNYFRLHLQDFVNATKVEEPLIAVAPKLLDAAQILISHLKYIDNGKWLNNRGGEMLIVAVNKVTNIQQKR